MTMYVPDRFRAPSRDAVLDIIRTYPLATLVSVVDGEPFVSYIPFTIARAEPDLILTGHCARANPHWKHFANGNVLLIFRGPDGYISPRFGQDCATNVPSWNYIAVHCSGIATVAADDETDNILRALVHRMEAQAENPWRMDDLRDDVFERLKKAIVPFAVQVTGVTAKFKLSQHASDGDVEGLIAGLRQTGAQNDRLLAEAMERAR